MALNEEYEKIGADIIGASFDVRKEVGRGLRECFYEGALAWELSQRGYNVERQVLIPAIYKGVEIADAYQADIVVNRRVIIELKALKQIKDGEVRQIFTYLKLSGLHLGYLINFGVKDFKIGKLRFETAPYLSGIYRIVNGL